MKYYSYGDVVMSFNDNVRWRTVLANMRMATKNSSIMIEDIQETDVEEYIAYLEILVQEQNIQINSLKNTIKRISTNDVEGLYGSAGLDDFEN